MAKVGDIVRYLNSVGGGRIVRIDGNTAYVDEDGFETPVLVRECVVVTPAAPAATSPKAAPAAQPAAYPQPVAEEPETDVVIEETPGGEKLNVLLAFESRDLKRLSVSDFEAFLVNDSNFYLSFTWLVREPDSKQWQARYIGEVEPGIVLHLGRLLRDELSEIDRIALQYIAYKRDKAFDQKPPVWVDRKFDATKFCKLHCFTPNPYFDDRVIAVPIVEDDVPIAMPKVDSADLAKAMQTKIKADNRPARKTKRPPQKADEPLVVDLHINELVDDTRGMSNADMLNLQIETFRKVMDANLRNHGKKLIFIHGKGEGVLRHALIKELNYRYKGHDVQDASFLEYGYGATQVKIK